MGAQVKRLPPPRPMADSCFPAALSRVSHANPKGLTIGDIRACTARCAPYRIGSTRSFHVRHIEGKLPVEGFRFFQKDNRFPDRGMRRFQHLLRLPQNKANHTLEARNIGIPGA